MGGWGPKDLRFLGNELRAQPAGASPAMGRRGLSPRPFTLSTAAASTFHLHLGMHFIDQKQHWPHFLQPMGGRNRTGAKASLLPPAASHPPTTNSRYCSNLPEWDKTANSLNRGLGGGVDRKEKEKKGLSYLEEEKKQYLGHAIYLKLKFNWVSYILSGHPTNKGWRGGRRRGGWIHARGRWWQRLQVGQGCGGGGWLSIGSHPCPLRERSHP